MGKELITGFKKQKLIIATSVLPCIVLNSQQLGHRWSHPVLLSRVTRWIAIVYYHVLRGLSRDVQLSMASNAV